MKKRKEAKVIQMHQHTDFNGNIFGMSHPMSAVHKNAKTQKAHIATMLIPVVEK